jgi:hypothetical protein
LYTNNGGSNTAVGQNALYSNSTGSNNTAVGFQSSEFNTTGTLNTSFGYQSLKANTTGTNNVAIGQTSLSLNTTGNENTAVGANTQSGNFSQCVILGLSAVATASNQFVVGSSGANAGTVTTEANTSTKVWNVKINGVDYKILLA